MSLVVRSPAAGLLRNTLFAAVGLIGFANGVAELAFRQVAADGWLSALFSTFGISAVVWLALAVSLRLLTSDDGGAPTRLDWAVAALAVAGFAIPDAKITWTVLTALAGYACLTLPAGGQARKGAVILLALTVPMLWSKILFSLTSGLVLEADAAMVAALLDRPRVGNTIDLGDGQGQLWIASGCSSLANLSLCFLCWAVLAQFAARPRSRRAVIALGVACAAVVAINVGRICLIGLHLDLYDLLHGPPGAMVASWVTAMAVLAICSVGFEIAILGSR